MAVTINSRAQRRRLTRGAAAIVAVILAVVVSGCGYDDALALTEDPAMLERAEQAIHHGQPVPLGDIIGQDFERVVMMPGESLSEQVEAAAGATVDMPYIYQRDRGGIVLLFAKSTDQVATRAISLNPWPFDGNNGNRQIRITIAVRPNPTAQWLRIKPATP